MQTPRQWGGGGARAGDDEDAWAELKGGRCHDAALATAGQPAPCGGGNLKRNRCLEGGVAARDEELRGRSLDAERGVVGDECGFGGGVSRGQEDAELPKDVGAAFAAAPDSRGVVEAEAWDLRGSGGSRRAGARPVRAARVASRRAGGRQGKKSRGAAAAGAAHDAGEGVGVGVDDGREAPVAADLGDCEKAQLTAEVALSAGPAGERRAGASEADEHESRLRCTETRLETRKSGVASEAELPRNANIVGVTEPRAAYPSPMAAGVQEAR